MTDIVERIKDAENATHALFNHIFQDAREEIERLRARIEEMEKQEPVCSQSFTDREWRAESATWAAAWKAAKRHGAQPAPSIPEGWKLMPLRMTQEMRDTWIECAFSPPDEIYEELLAAAPEAKP